MKKLYVVEVFVKSTLTQAMTDRLTVLKEFKAKIEGLQIFKLN